jgi:hypothetical protein
MKKWHSHFFIPSHPQASRSSLVQRGILWLSQNVCLPDPPECSEGSHGYRRMSVFQIHPSAARDLMVIAIPIPPMQERPQNSTEAKSQIFNRTLQINYIYILTIVRLILIPPKNSIIAALQLICDLGNYMTTNIFAALQLCLAAEPR